jgi:hypothetical protein
MFISDIPPDELNLLRILEDAIVERLSQLTEVGATRIEAYPAKEDSGQPVPKGLLQVAYTDSLWTRPRSRNDPVQGEEMQFQLVWRLRDLRTHQEAYALLRATVWLLKGFCPIGCYDSCFYPLGASFVEQDEQGYWTYYQKFGYQLPPS